MSTESTLDALEILCRVFDDGADAAYDEWLAWYKPESWLHPSRALGAFIRNRLEAKGEFTATERQAIDALDSSMRLVSGSGAPVFISMLHANALRSALAAPIHTNYRDALERFYCAWTEMWGGDNLGVLLDDVEALVGDRWKRWSDDAPDAPSTQPTPSPTDPAQLEIPDASTPLTTEGSL